MSGNAAGLYQQDFVRWTEEQSSALREAARFGTNLPLDWENLAEEIESLGSSQRHELRSASLTSASYTADQVLGDWFPEVPPRP